jgi:signal peptidase I
MEKKKSKTQEYIEAIVVAVVIAFFVRSFFIQAFKIPSSSMEPTLLIGDHLLVNRLSYVVKVPFEDSVLFDIGKAKRGDIVVFRYPVDRSKDFIKRVVAVEGETIEIRNKVVYVNGEAVKDPWAHFADHQIIPGVLSPKDNFGPVKVPKESYFAMGDNRDRSLDSRFWGFVHQKDLVGRALILYFSWDSKAENPLNHIRWDRLGKIIR